MLNKKKVIASLREMPDEFSVEDVFDRIILLQKIEEGLMDSANGNVHSTVEAKKKLKKWLK